MRPVVVAVALVALAACSSVPGRSESEAEPLSKEAFVEQANRICRKTQAEARGIAAPSLADPRAVQESILESASIQRRALRKLRDLEPPETDAPGIRNWLDLVDGTVDEMEALAQAVAAGDRDEMTSAIERGDALTADAEAFTAAYGLLDCTTEPPEEDEGQGEG